MDQKNFEADVRPLYSNKTTYDLWVEAQNVPVIREFYIENLRKTELAPWDAKGGSGALQIFPTPRSPRAPVPG